MEDVLAVLKRAREKRLMLQRQEDALAASIEKAQLRGVSFGERVQTSTKATLDSALESIEEERLRLVEIRSEADRLTEEAKALIDHLDRSSIAYGILWHRYILCHGWGQIARDFHYGKTRVFLISTEGVRKIHEKMGQE